MTKIYEELSKWRDYFGSTNLDIFDIIENAVMVAAIDHSNEFKLRRDRIAELLFTCKNTSSNLDCDKIEFVIPNADKVVPNVGKVEFVVPKADELVPNGVDKGKRKCENEIVRALEGCDDKERRNDGNVNNINNVSYKEVEALSDEIEEEARIVEEVLRIKEIIDNNQNESDSNVYESLRRLQFMDISLETLKDTNIGKSVHALRRHNSTNIHNLVKMLVGNWMGMVDEWMNARATFADRTPESMKASIVNEEGKGLPSPPLEDLPYLSTQSTSMPLSKFFDGMDDDGNLRSNGECSKNNVNSQKTSVEKNNPVREQQFTKNVNAAPKDKQDEQPKKETSVVKPNNPPRDNSRPGRPTKQTFQPKLNNDEMMRLQQKSDKSKFQMIRPVPTQQSKLQYPDEDIAHDMKVEAAKRKFQERYQEVENAKKQRTTQMIKLSDIPKESVNKLQGPGYRNFQITMRPGSLNRRLVNKRQ
ncbi:unnamed protein product [Withania somnifera]